MARVVSTAAPRLGNHLRLGGAIRLSRLLEMPEEEMERWEAGLEQNPLFQKLRRLGIVRYTRYPRSGWAFSPFEIDENRLAGDSHEALPDLARHSRLLGQIRRMGRSLFEKYFLYAEESLTLKEIARASRIPLSLAREIQRFVDSVYARSLFSAPLESPGPTPRAARVAHVARIGRRLFLQYTSLRQARGRYRVDSERLRVLRNGEALSSHEKDQRDLSILLRNLGLVNARKDTFHRILEALLKHQRAFFFSGHTEGLRPLTQKVLARKLNRSPSSICRMLSGRSLLTPERQEISLRSLLPSRKSMAALWVREALSAKPALTDDELTKLIVFRHPGPLSRRSVNSYRHAT